MANHNRLLQAQSLAKDLYDVTKNEASTRANPPQGQDINKIILKKLIDKACDAWRAYSSASLAFYIQGTFAEEGEISGLFNQFSLEHATHYDWLEHVEQILRNLELADNPPVQQGINAITNWVKQLDEVTTSIAKFCRLHKENTELFTINPTFQEEAREEIQEQVKENVEKVNPMLESGFVSIKNTAKEKVTSAVDDIDYIACEDIDLLTTKFPALKEAIPELTETNRDPTAGITKCMKSQVGSASREIKTITKAEAILARTDVVIFDPGAADSTVQTFSRTAAKLREDYTFAHTYTFAGKVKTTLGQREGMLMIRPKHLQNQFDTTIVYDGSTSDKGALAIWIADNIHGLCGPQDAHCGYLLHC